MSDHDLERADTLVADGVRDRDVVHEAPGTLIAGRYEVVSVLGDGGMGTVYLARDRHLDELIALKILLAEVASGEELVDALRREVVLARRVTHRNVARTFDFGADGDGYFITMEYVDGEPLSAIAARRRLSAARSIAVLTDVARALDAAHAAGVVHRDVKPDNVIVARDGRVVVTDFGVARGAGDGGAGELAGTPSYMAPEVLAGEAADVRSDVFSFGVLAFELLTGARPWGSDRSLAAARARADSAPPDPRTIEPALPTGVAAALTRALARDPAARFAATGQLAEALAAGTGGSPTPTPLATMPPPSHAPSASPRARAPVVAVAPFAAEAVEPHLARGFTEELIACLGATGAVQVLSSAAVATAAAGASPAQRASRLGVDYLASGGLRARDGEIVVTVRAHDASGGRRLLRRWQAPAAELLSVAEEVAFELAPVLGTGAVRRGIHDVLPNDEALDLFLRARDKYYELAVADESLALFERARALAPASPLIAAGYAMALLRNWMLSEHDPALAARAADLAREALRAAPELGDVHLALGYLHLHHGDPVEAMRSFARAVARSPSSPEVHAILGSLLVEMGRDEDAERRIATSLRLDPSQVMAQMARHRLAALRGDWDAVDAMGGDLGSPPATSVAWLNPVRLAAYRGERERLRAYAARIAESEDRFGMRAIAQTLALVFAGDAPVEHGYSLLRDTGPRQGVSSRRLAMGYQIRAEIAGNAGDLDTLCTSIERAETHGFFDLFWLDRCTLLAPARDAPRFLAARTRAASRCHAMYDAFWTA